MAFEAGSPETSNVYVQRVIRTDLFLNEKQVEPFFNTDEPPTLGVAWLHDRTFPNNDNFFSVQPFFHSGGQPTIRLFIDTSIAIEVILRLQGAEQEQVNDFIRHRQGAAYISSDKDSYPLSPPPFGLAMLKQSIVV